MRRENPDTGLVVFWVKLRRRGYTRSISGLYRFLRKSGQMAVKLPNPKYIPKPYEQMQYPGQRVQIDVKYVPKSCLVGAAEEGGYYQYTFLDEYSRFGYLEAFQEHSTYSSAQFIRNCVKKFPFPIERVQTDNGSEFTNRLISGQSARPTLFESTPARQWKNRAAVYPKPEALRSAIPEGDPERISFFTNVLRESAASGECSRFMRSSICHDIINSCFRSAEELEKLFLQSLSQAEEAAPPQENGESRAYIDTCADAGQLSVGAVAEYFGLSISNLSHRFKKQTGVNVSEYITARRIECAKQLLTETGLTLSGIAQRLGYPQTSSFMRVFKSCVGMTPR